MITRRYYLAYGMNTNLAQMALRCPAAKSLGPVKLKDHKLAFKLFCDAVVSEGDSMDCVLWTITDRCEAALDRLEGYPDFYGKKEVTVFYQSKPIKAMIYYMTDFYKSSLPSEHYLKTVTEGYLDHNMNLEQIYHAIDEVTEYEHNTW
jgi:gamma-glutamylcyclotransferase (GGCT)/AIG2-like uncharacterized protein YtfP